MLASILIIGCSVVMFLYWFRYTCLLILHAEPAKRYAGRVAAANRLSFLNIQTALRKQESIALDTLHRSLDNDYRIVSYLIQHASGLGAHSVEQKIIMVDYRVMQVWYRLTRNVSEVHARKALEEMSNILAYFANAMGQRAASLSEV
jgi:hypothetical protein